MELRAIYEITATVLLCLFGVLLLIQFSAPMLRGIRWLSSAYAVGGVGIGLIGIRDHLPVFVSIIVSNVLISLVNVFLYWGVQEVVRSRKRRLWLLPAAVLSTLALFLYYTYVDDRLAPRIVAHSAITTCGELLLVHLVLTNGNHRTRFPRFAIAGLAIFWGIANIYRMLFAIWHQPTTVFHEVNHVSNILLIVPLVEVMMLGLGLIWLTTAYLQVDLEDLSRTDALTGLLNRRAFDADALEQLTIARKSGAPLAMLFVDLDHFKLVNDVHGHAAGDIVLTMAAHCIRQNLRQFERIARYGGEEFLIFLPNTTPQDAASIAERLRACLADLTVPYLQSEIQLSASLGVASFQPDSDSWDDLLSRADAALYQAKREGRNRVCVT